MKTHLLTLFLLTHSALAFVPVTVTRKAHPTYLSGSVNRDEIASEIQSIEHNPHVTTHDENTWKEVLAVEHDSRKHALKKKLGAIKMENQQLDKQVHALENKLESLFAVTEVLYVREAELQEQVKDLKSERSSLRKTAGRAVVLFGKRLLWPARAVLRLVGVKKTDMENE